MSNVLRAGGTHRDRGGGGDGGAPGSRRGGEGEAAGERTHTYARQTLRTGITVATHALLSPQATKDALRARREARHEAEAEAERKATSEKQREDDARMDTEHDAKVAEARRAVTGRHLEPKLAVATASR